MLTMLLVPRPATNPMTSKDNAGILPRDTNAQQPIAANAVALQTALAPQRKSNRLVPSLNGWRFNSGLDLIDFAVLHILFLNSAADSLHHGEG